MYCCLVTRTQVKVAKRSFDNGAQFIYFGATVTHQNLIQEEIEWGLNSATFATRDKRPGLGG
jgi:hypothetical protein